MTKKKDNKPEFVKETLPRRKGKKEEAIKDLGAIGDAVVAAKNLPAADDSQPRATEKKIPKLDKLGRSYATGRRKNAVARVWIKPGSGKVTVNGKEQSSYFSRQTHLLILNQPFLIADRVGRFDVFATVTGGGLSGQAGAVRHGIARALENFDPALRPPLKKAGMITRDPRIVERKKVGKHKARRTKQWAKR